MDIEMFGKLSDAFGPSGFEEDVIRTIADYCKEFDVENDAMNNLYAVSYTHLSHDLQDPPLLRF